MAVQRIPTGILVLIAVTIAIGALVAATLLLSGSHAQAASVEPEVLAGASNTGKTCSDLEGAGQTWIEFKLEGGELTDGAHTAGPLTVTISNLTNTAFDWTSNIGVDGIVVKDGVDGANFYVYDPPTEEKSDTDLSVPGERGISHISFCYDLPDATPTPTPTPTATATAPAGATPTATPTATLATTPAATPAVLGVTALPDTGQPPGGSSNWVLPLLALGGLLLLAGAGTLATVKVRRRR